MIVGLDRPLKPIWIHNYLRILEPGDTNKDVKRKFDAVVFERAGKEGRRKIRTIVLRYFVDTAGKGNKLKVIESPLLTYSKNFDINFMSPLYLLVLLIKGPSIRYVFERMLNYAVGKDSVSRDIIYWIASEKMGEREIVRRFTNCFITTMANFNVLEPVVEDKYVLKRRIELSEERIAVWILLYTWYVSGRVLTLNTLEDLKFLDFFDMGDLESVIQKYNGILWEIRYRPKSTVVSIKNDAYFEVVSVVYKQSERSLSR